MSTDATGSLAPGPFRRTSPPREARSLPAALTPWATQLAFLSPELTSAIGPLIRRLDSAMPAPVPIPSRQEEFDGYGGITRRGRPELLLASEWALADEFGDEFLRRAVEGELLHLDSEFVEPRGAGAVVAVVDAGPYAAGAPRLVQLAGLVVLGRRAEARGTELVVRVLGDSERRGLRGDLGVVLAQWVRLRRQRGASTDAVAAALADLTSDDEAWVFAPAHLAGSGPDRIVTAVESAWQEHGASHLRVQVGTAASFELPLPAPDLALRALRGQEFRTASPPTTKAQRRDRGTLRCPTFTGPSPHLLMRGAGPGDVASVYVPAKPGQQRGRIRRYTFPGTVLGASWIDRRLVAVCCAGARLSVHVVGRDWPEVPTDHMSAPAAEFGATEAVVARAADEPVQPVFRLGDGFVTRIGARWVRLHADGAEVTPYTAMAANPAGDGDPLRTWEAPGQVTVTGGPKPWTVARVSRHVLGAGLMAWCTEDRREWTVGAHAVHPIGRFTIDADTRPIGLVLREDGPGLITRSKNGLIIAVHTTEHKRVLTRWSGGPVLPVVHPTRPLIAHGDRGVVRVGDAFTGAEIIALRSAP